MGACGDQTVSHAAGAQKLVAESHFQGKASIAKAWGAHASAPVVFGK